MKNDWPEVSIDDVITLNRSGYWGNSETSAVRANRVKVVRNADVSRDGELRGFAERYFSDKELGVARLLPDDIAFSTSGEVGKAWQVEADGYCASNFIRILRPNLKLLAPGFLRLALATDGVRRALVENTTGATIQNLQKAFFARARFPLPPLHEQRRIVRVLEKAFLWLAATHANAEKSLQFARALLESHLQSVFTDRGKAWKTQSLESLCALFFDSAHRTPKYQEKGIPALRPRDVVNGKLNLGSALRVTQAEYDIQTRRHKPCPGDIVYSRELSYGWAVLLPESPRVCLSQGMCLFRPSICMNPHFLLYVLNGSIGREQARRSAVGAAHPHINLADIKAYRIPVPPVVEQQDIVEEFNALATEIQRLTRLFENKRVALAALRKSLLHRAFIGEL